MQRRTDSNTTATGKENSKTRVRSNELPRQGYVSIIGYLGATTTLTDAARAHSNIEAQGVQQASRANWFSGLKDNHVDAQISTCGLSYFQAPNVPLLGEYVTNLSRFDSSSAEASMTESLAFSISSEECRAKQQHEKAVDAYNVTIDELLQQNGFINRVEIKKGVTACVAVFKYTGDDAAIKAITKCGYIMVKLPPYTAARSSLSIVASDSASMSDGKIGYVGVALPQQTSAQIHAELTYNNEYNLVSQMRSLSLDGSRPHVLAVELGGQKFIFNSPVFFNEDEFIESHSAILRGDGKHLFLSRDSESSHDEDSLSESDFDPDEMNQFLIASLLQQSFLNLSCRMQRISLSENNPIKKINALFASTFNAVNRLHNDGFVHADIAGRNIVPRSDGTVALVDFGTADTLNRVNGNARLNIKFPQSSIMHNNDALRSENHLIGVITDYISLQKTLLQAIAEYMDANFYRLTIQGLPDAPENITVEYLLRFTDRIILDNVKKNLISFAETLVYQGKEQGTHALALLKQYEPYFDHDHNPDDTFAELQAAHKASFIKCSPSSYVMRPRCNTAEKLHAYHTLVKDKNTNQPAPARTISRKNTAEKISLFSRSRSNSQTEPRSSLSRDISRKL